MHVRIVPAARRPHLSGAVVCRILPVYGVIRTGNPTFLELQFLRRFLINSNLF